MIVHRIFSLSARFCASFSVPCSLGVLLVAPAAAQTLQNPGFEASYGSFTEAPTCTAVSGSIANAWIDNSCWAGNETSQVTYAQATAGVHGGSSAQTITVQSGIMQCVQYLDFVSGTRYTASVWMRAPQEMTVQLWLRKAGAPYTVYAGREFDLTPTWTRYVVEGLTETGSGMFMIRTEDTGAFTVDDAELFATPIALELPTSPVPEEYFGMHMHRSDTSWPREEANISAVRIWDSDGVPGGVGAQWASVNWAAGQYDWTAIDAHVARATARGASVLYVLGRTPQWASARPTEPSPYGPGQAAEPSDLNDWRAWVTAVGTRYQGQIKYWEVWNEPNDAQFYSGTPELLVTLAQEAHAILKGIDATNVVLTPSPYDLGYLDQYLALGGGAYADVVGYHFYLINTEPEYLLGSYIPGAKIIMDSHGLSSLPLWDTEAGWWNGPALPEQQGVGYVSRSVLLNWAAGADRFYFYSWDPGSVAGVDLAVGPDYEVLTSAGEAYRETSRWMLGTTMTDLEVDANDNWALELTRPGGTRAWVLWNPSASASQPASFPVPAAWSVRARRDLAGQVTTFAGGSIALEQRPILVEQESLLATSDCDCTASAPCSNANFDGGCVNSTGLGARLIPSGSSSVSRDDLTLWAVQLPPNTFGLIFMGRGSNTFPLGAGLRCVSSGNGTGLFRFPVLPTGPTGEFQIGPGLVAHSATTFGFGNGAIDPGETWRFQCWVRDMLNACGQETNVSKAVAVSFY